MIRPSPRIEQVFDRLSMMRQGKFDLSAPHPRRWRVPVNEDEGQLDVDRFYRYNETLQQFFDGAARLGTRFAENGG